jgi:hypothetical protein
MTGDWSEHEDRRRGVQMFRTQPELTAKGKTWTQLIWFELNGKKYHTQLVIRDFEDRLEIGHGRVYSVSEEDGG